MSTPEQTTRELLPPADAPATPGTELTLPERARAAIRLAETEAQLQELAASTATITTITNAAGRAQAHAAAMVLREKRLAIQSAGDAARDEARTFAKEVIVQQGKLVGLIQPEEERLKKLRDDWDNAREAELAAKAEAERERVRTIHGCIQEMRETVAECAGKSAAEIDAVIRSFTGIVINADNYAEFAESAQQVHANVLARLRSMHAAQVQADQQRAQFEAKARQQQADLDTEIARQRQQRELNALRLKRIGHINGLVLVATTGRQGRKPGTRECITETLADVRAVLINDAEFGDMLDAATAARDAAVQQIEHILQRFDQRERDHVEQQLNQSRLGEIQAIGHQVLIASTGRLGVRTGGTRECIVETLAETKAWPVGEDKFGNLAGMAHAARIRACEQIQALLDAFDERARQQAEQQRLDEERERAQAEHARIAQENARQAEDLRRQQDAIAEEQRKLDADRQQVEVLQASLAGPPPAAETTPEAIAPSSDIPAEAPIACKCCGVLGGSDLCNRCWDIDHCITPQTAVYAITRACEVLGILEVITAATLLKTARKAQAKLQAQAGAQ